jgi:hypothetical protein
MATEINIDGFHYDEYVEILFQGRDRSGYPLSDAASQVITLVISGTAGGVADPGGEWSTATGHIVLVDAPEAKWEISLTPDDLSDLSEGKVYYYNIWSQLTPDTPILQAKGRFTLLDSINPS